MPSFLDLNVGIDRLMGLQVFMTLNLPDRYATLEYYRPQVGPSMFQVSEVVGVVDFGEA